ncbi:MAG: LysM peptidoglycan-binding domain-containing protein [Deltaproteobacteria bacterium]|nr:LysM peptidoglycan-binding domain-containing protein [Deltaproteobacteria bacterium]
MGKRFKGSGKGWFLLAFLVVSGCRGIEPEPGRQHDHSLFPKALTEREWYPRNVGPPGRARPDLGPLDPKAVVNQVLAGPLEPYDIRIAPEDTLDLYAKWTGRTIQGLLDLNPGAKQRGLVAGEGFHLVLTHGEFARFNGSRTAYLAKVRARREQGMDVINVVKHRVRPNETLAHILGRYRTNLDLLEKMNPKVRLRGVMVGQVLKVPIIAPATGDRPSMPGPRPPTPHPVPQPPAETRPVTVDSDDEPAPARPEYYVVISGDTAWKVARRKLNISLDALTAANPEIDLERLRPGMRLAVPGHSSQPGAPTPE